MKTRSLVIVAIVAMLGAIWMASTRSPQSTAIEGGALAPGLSEMLGDVRQVRISGGSNVVLATLQRDDDGDWRLQEKGGYRVDVEKLRSLLASIVLAQRVEGKTALPERHAQLGVEHIAVADAQGVQVDIDAGSRHVSLVFGDNVARGSGTYVRHANEDQSWLIDTTIEVERTPANWLVKDLIDIGANRIAAIQVTPAEGAVIELVRTQDDPDSDFAFVSLPRGREPAAGYMREALAGVLSGLVFEDVSPVSELAEPEAVQVARFSLSDGRQLTLRTWSEDGHTLARISMTLDQGAARAWLEARPVLAAAEQLGNDAADTPAGGRQQPETLESLTAEVGDFGRLHGDWIYVLPAYKASNLNKGLGDYLKPQE